MQIPYVFVTHRMYVRNACEYLNEKYLQHFLDSDYTSIFIIVEMHIRMVST